jgi:hypothetical protein
MCGTFRTPASTPPGASFPAQNTLLDPRGAPFGALNCSADFPPSRRDMRESRLTRRSRRGSIGRTTFGCPAGVFGNDRPRKGAESSNGSMVICRQFVSISRLGAFMQHSGVRGRAMAPPFGAWPKFVRHLQADRWTVIPSGELSATARITVGWWSSPKENSLSGPFSAKRAGATRKSAAGGDDRVCAGRW